MNLFNYFLWHFFKAPKDFLIIIYNYWLFCGHFFSLKTLLGSLFAPWKRITFSQKPGFSLSHYFETFISNLVSRLLGAMVRSCLIFIGLLAQLAVLLLGLVLLIVFLFLPGLTLPLFLWLENKKRKKAERHKLLAFFSTKPLPNLTAQQFAQLVKNPAGRFLTSRLLIKQNDIGKLSLTEILNQYLLEENDLYEVARWYVHAQDEEEEYGAFWQKENLLRTPALASDWTYGYTVNLDQYSTDIIAKGYHIPHLVGRRLEIDKIQRTLARNDQNNVVVVGDPGSGRHAVVLAFALDVFEGKVLKQLKGKRVVELNFDLLLSDVKLENEIKGKITQVLKEAREAGNIILVIDNFERLVGGTKDSLDLTDVFQQNFAGADLQVIAITTREFYHKSIMINPTLNKLFEVVEIEEISPSDTLKVLEHLTPFLEKEYKIFIPFTALKETLKKSQLIAQIPNPEKAIDVLKEAAVLAASRKERILKPELINEIIAQKTKIPQAALLAEEKEKLKNLEKLLHQWVIDQEEAISLIAQSLRRARLEISAKGKPIGTFLFLGPTGVGKTETAKTLARVYFGSEKRMIRIDMSQHQGKEAINSLLGNPVSAEPGLLVKAVRDNPFSVLLLDEIEKTSPEVLNLFLTILDEGYINDSFGRRVSFENTIIIGTSNAGSEFIRQKSQENIPALEFSKILIDYVLKEKIFSPEFINRFDAVVVYQPLKPDHLYKITHLLLIKLNQRLAERKITLKITDSLINQIVQAGYNPQFGARGIKRIIQDKVEDYIARQLLNDEIKPGQIIEINSL